VFRNTNDTIVALATPPGVGAIGVIRLSGSNAIGCIDAVFRGNDLTKVDGYTVHFGKVVDSDRVVDEVLVSVFKAPKSYTGEDIAEISCHGSPYILQEVIGLLIAQGARLAEPGEFTLRAFLNGKMDLSQAEAVADLIASTSEASHKLAMDQMRGGFKKRIEALRAELIHFASMIELELDFGEEDVEFADRGELTRLVNEILKIINELVDSFRYGNVLKHGVYTVIAGRPNAGKSTLLNKLLNEERAIVSEIEGTTRDTIEDVLNIEGLTFRLVDTAGIREATDQIEQKGIERTMDSVLKSSLLIYVYDAARLEAENVQKDLEMLDASRIPHITIANKSDLLNDGSSQVDEHWYMSARDDEDVKDLKSHMFEKVVNEIQTDGDVVVGNLRHLQSLKESKGALERVLDGLANETPSDLVAMDIREALYQLGLITGEVTTDDLLENIFRNFCIGK